MDFIMLDNGFRYEAFDDEDTKAVWSRPAYIRYHRGSGLFDVSCYSMSEAQTHTWRKVSGSDLLMERQSPSPEAKWTDISGKAYADLIALRKRYFVSASKLEEAMRQEHRKRLGRCGSAWVELAKKDYESALAKRAMTMRASIDPQNIANAERILEKSARRGDIDAFLAMCKDLGMGKQPGLAKWKEMRGR